jgi:predicted hydrocarbon binding protein
MTAAPEYFYPGRMGRIVFLAMEEVLGRESAGAVLDLAGLSEYREAAARTGEPRGLPFDHITRLQMGLERAYGEGPGRGLAVRIGRVCLKYGLREFAPELGLGEPAFRLLPLPARIRAASESLADLFNTHSDQRVRLACENGRLYWHIERCPLCWGRLANDPPGESGGGPCCHLAVGLIQEGLSWLSGGRCFRVVEEKCFACGDSACTIVIDLTPLS